MTQEEKAKAYDRALKTCKEVFNFNNLSYTHCEIKEKLEQIFPELRKSEDERIREEIVEYFKHYSGGDDVSIKFPKWIAYLKKQKELPFVKDVMLGYPGLYFYDGERMHFQGNPAMEEKQKEQRLAFTWRRVEDVTTKRTDEGDCVTTEKILVKGLIDDEDYCIIDKDVMVNKNLLCIPVRELNAGQEPAEWSEEDKLIIHNIVFWLDGQYISEAARMQCLEWIKSLPERFVPQPKQEWSEEEIQKLNRITVILYEAGTTQCWYEKKRICEREEADSLCDFLKSLRPLPKVEWSEEEEQWLESIIKDYEDSLTKDKDHAAVIKIKIDFLKSLRPHWKPSEEQMKALKASYSVLKAHDTWGEDEHLPLLLSLYNDLKKHFNHENNKI